MQYAHKLELMLAKQFAKAPHLPENVRKWLADNAWWITLIGVVITVFGLLSVFALLAFAGIGLAIGGAALGGVIGATAGAAIGGVLLLSMLLTAALYIAQIVLFGMAISPLKAKVFRGWNLVFIAVALGAAVDIISNVISLNIFKLILDLVIDGFAAYIVFEVREYFVTKHVVDAKVVKTKKVKA